MAGFTETEMLGCGRHIIRLRAGGDGQIQAPTVRLPADQAAAALRRHPEPTRPTDLIEKVAASIPNASVIVVNDGDHSFKVTKRAGKTNEQVLAGVVRESVVWIGTKT